MLTPSLFYLLYFFIHSIVTSSAIPQQIQFLENENAKNKFCSQTFFNSLSYDGQSYRFTVKRRQFLSSFESFVYEEFRLRYHLDSNQFTYQMSTYSFSNLVPLGGFYAKNFQIYIEFYRNLSKSAMDQHRYMYCVYPNSKISSNAKILDECNCNRPNKACLLPTEPSKKYAFFPECLLCHLKHKTFVTFVYQPDTQKMIYIFSNRTDPIVISSTRIVDLQNHITWFTKSIAYKGYRFIGAFNWHTTDSNKIFVLVESNWKRKNLTLLEVIDTKKFVLSIKKHPWKAFFGCQPSLGRIEHLSLSKRHSNKFVLYIGSLILLIVAFTLVVAIRNLSGLKHKRWTPFWPFRSFQNKYLSRFISIN